MTKIKITNAILQRLLVSLAPESLGFVTIGHIDQGFQTARSDECARRSDVTRCRVDGLIGSATEITRRRVFHDTADAYYEEAGLYTYDHGELLLLGGNGESYWWRNT